MTRPGHPIPLAICVGLTLFYGVMSFWAVSGKSSTYDEPMHALGGWVHRHYGDFRINFEDPPLWQYWATLLNGQKAITVDRNNPYWQHMPQNVYDQWSFTLDTLYRTPGNDGEWFVLKQRLMMVLAGMGLCAVVARWSWRLAGPIGAVIATALVSLDPNLLGHGALVKNDVPLGLMMAAVFFLAWRVGERLTWANGLGLAAVVAMAVNVKFSSLMFGPMLVILMGMRVVLPRPWEVLGKMLSRWYEKLFAVLGLFAAVGIVSYITIWATYGFRFNPSPDPAVRLNTYAHKIETIKAKYKAAFNPPGIPEGNPGLPLDQLLVQYVQQFNAFAKADADLRQSLANARIEETTRQDVLTRLGRNQALQTQAQQVFDNAQLFLPQNVPAPENRATDFAEKYGQAATALEQMRFGLWGEEHDPDIGIRLYVYWLSVGDEAPDRFIGLLNVAMSYRLLPSGYLHGVLFVHARSIIRSSFLMGKVSGTGWWYYFPLAMLFKTPVAALIALAGAGATGVWLLVKRTHPWQQWLWPAACLVVPVAIYLFSVMSANLNIGIRHILCVYPLLYVAAAVMLLRALSLWPWVVRMHLFALGAVLLIESLAAFPNYIAYFNFAFGGSRGGFNLLADSNLDWGQDLPLLKEWQKQNPDAQLALGYFGIVEGVERPLPDGRKQQVSEWTTLPTFYEIKFAPYGPGFTPVPADPSQAPGYVVAISATELQGVYNRNAYAAYRQFQPTEVLGGTIYLFDLRK